MEPLRLKAGKDSYKELTMNGFCEKILWDYATGRISEVTAKSIQAVVDRVEIESKPPKALGDSGRSKTG